MDWLLGAVGLFWCMLVLGILLEHRRYQQRNRQQIDRQYATSLQAHDIEAAVVCKETLELGRKTRFGRKPFEVHRILHVEPDAWYVYIHVENDDPVVTAISEQRAKQTIAH